MSQKEISWITAKDIKTTIVKLLRSIYPQNQYHIYGKPVTDGLLIPAFFVDVRLGDRSDATSNIVNKEYRVHILYFQEDPESETAEADQFDKIEEIGDLLCCTDQRNRKRNMCIECNGRYLQVKEFSSDYTGSAVNILTIDFTLQFYDWRQEAVPEPIMEEFTLNEIFEEEE